MELQELIGGVKLDELMIQLLEVYSNIERVLTSRLPHGVWTTSESKRGARQTLETLLRNTVQEGLNRVLPGIGIQWDDHLDIQPVYSTSSIAIIDPVDGANEYLREGAEVTSHLGIYARNGDDIGKLQLGVVSYPFHGFRLIAIGGEQGYVSYTPISEDVLVGNAVQKLRAGKLATPPPKTTAEALYVIDRYENYNPKDPLRRNLDPWRLRWAEKGKYGTPQGSMAKSIVDLTLGVWDIAIFRHEPSSPRPIPQSEYMTPQRILEMNGGVFTDLDGRKPERGDITGFIAAANQKAYDLFREALGRAVHG